MSHTLYHILIVIRFMAVLSTIMKKYISLYYERMGLVLGDHIFCEVCLKKASDIHHIIPKGVGGDKRKDVFDNLIALCRGCHTKAHSGDLSIQGLKTITDKRNGGTA